MPNLSCKRRHVNGKTATAIQNPTYGFRLPSVSAKSLRVGACCASRNHGNWRSQIVPAPPERATETSSEDAHAQARMSWAWLLKRVFDIDSEHFPNCGGALKTKIGRDRAAEVAFQVKRRASKANSCGFPIVIFLKSGWAGLST